MICLLCALRALCGESSSAFAQKKSADKKDAPQIVVALPLAVDAGKTTKLSVRGLRLDGVTEVRLHEPHSTGKVVSKASKVGVPNNTPPELVGDSQIDIEVTLPAEVPGTTLTFSLVSESGESKPHAVLVNDETPRVPEKEPNDGFRTSQPLAFPQIVEGTIGRDQDVDVFRFDARAGATYTFELQAARFGSRVDGVLTLYDAKGRVVAVSDDPPHHGDPKLEATLSAAGTYYLSLIDAHDSGGATHVYRLLARTK
jgi:hypothetical protein